MGKIGMEVGSVLGGERPVCRPTLPLQEGLPFSSASPDELDMFPAVLFACAALQASVRLRTCLHFSQFALAVVPGCAHVSMCVPPPLGCARVGLVLA